MLEVSNPSSIFANVTVGHNSSHIKLYDKLAGCNEVCPFCKEECELNDPHHKGPHAAFLHRPGCLGSNVWLKNCQLVLNLCTECINTDLTFQNSDTKFKPVKYKKYKKIYPKWDMPCDTKEDPLYWKWFVTK